MKTLNKNIQINLFRYFLSSLNEMAIIEIIKFCEKKIQNIFGILNDPLFFH